MGGVFDEDLDSRVSDEALYIPYVGNLAAQVYRPLVQFRAAESAGHGTAGPEQQLGSQPRGSLRNIYHCGQRDRLAAVIGVQEFLPYLGEISRFPERFQVEVHRSAADQSIPGRDILVQKVVLELGPSVVAQDLLRRKPDVPFDAAAAQGPQPAPVVPDQEHCSRFLGSGPLGSHHRGQDTRLPFFEKLHRLLNDFLHISPPLWRKLSHRSRGGQAPPPFGPLPNYIPTVPGCYTAPRSCDESRPPWAIACPPISLIGPPGNHTRRLGDCVQTP